jgi:hypothetical protein
MLKYFFISTFLAVIALVVILGWQGKTSIQTPIEIFPDMVRQPRFDAQHTSDFFADSRAARPPVAGTVPIGYTLPGTYLTNGASNSTDIVRSNGFSNATDYYSTGRIGDSYGDGLPLEVSAKLIQRGRERFTINCAICHGATGAANGIVTQYNLVGVASFQDQRLRDMPDGQIFNTITRGKNKMGAYGANIAVEDRWAIVAYIRALERSQGGATVEDVPEAERAQLDKEVKK